MKRFLMLMISACMFFSMPSTVKAEGEPDEGTTEEITEEVISQEESTETEIIEEDDPEEIEETEPEEIDEETIDEDESSEDAEVIDSDPEEGLTEITQEEEPAESEDPAESLPDDDTEEEPAAQEDVSDDSTAFETVVINAPESDGYSLTYVERTDGNLSVMLAEVSGTDVDITIPASFNGKKVTVFQPNKVLYDNQNNIASFSFPDTIREIAANLYGFAYSSSGGSVWMDYYSDTTQVYASDYGPNPKTNSSAFLINKPDENKPINDIPGYISSRYTDGAYYAGKCLVRVDPNYSGPFKVKAGTICILAHALAGCKNITSVTLPDSVEFIGTGAFMFSGITSINLPKSLKTSGAPTIPAYTFYGCDKLQTVKISGTIDTIGYGAFVDCTALKTLDFTKVKSIESCSFIHAFDPAGKVNADLSKLTYLGKYAVFAFSGLQSVTLPKADSLYLHNLMFYDNPALENVYGGNTVITAGPSAFEKCTALKVFEPKISRVESWAFYEAFSPDSKQILDLTSVGNFRRTQYSSTDVFGNSNVYGVNLGSAEKVEEIPYRAFYNAKNLTTVKASNAHLIDIGTSSFENCSALKSFEIKLGKIKSYAFKNAFDPAGGMIIDLTTADFGIEVNYGGGNTQIQFGTEQFAGAGIKGVIFGDSTNNYIPHKSFYNCKNLSQITFTPYQTTIGTEAFNGCISLTDDILAGTNFERIEYKAIAGTSITEITIPEHIKYLHGGALADNTKLETLNWRAESPDLCTAQLFAVLNDSASHYPIPSTSNDGYNSYFDRDMSIFATAPKTLNLYVPATSNTGTKYLKMLPTIETVNFMYDVEEIPAEAFQGCLSLKHVNFSNPDALKRIGDRAFAMSGLEEAVILNGVEYGDYVFQGDALLRKVVVEDGVTELGDFMFDGADNLELVSLPNTLQKINWGAFKCALNGTLLYIPESVTLIEDDAFARTDYYTPGSAEYSGAGKSADGELQLIIAGDPMIETMHDGGYLAENNLLAIPPEVSVVYTNEGINFLAYKSYAGEINSQPVPSEVELTVENTPKRVAAGDELDTSSMVVKLDGVELESSDYTLDYDPADLKAGNRTVNVLVNAELTNGPVLVEDMTSASSIDGSTVQGRIYHLKDGAELSFTVKVLNKENTDEDERNPVALDHEYIILDHGESLKLSVVAPEGFQTAGVTWSTENSVNTPYGEEATEIITVEDGLVTAGETEGTAYVLATITDQSGAEYYARCRVDVITKDIREDLKEYGVRLIDTKAKVALLSTNYTPVRVQLTLQQNLEGSGIMSDDASEDEEEAEQETAKIESAEFTNRVVSNIFDLKVYDDLTVEIIPKAEYVTTDAAVLKTVKSSYKSAITVVIDGKPYTSDQVLKITVDKKLPKVTVSAVTLNSFMDDEKVLKVKGGTVESITTTDTIPWLDLEEYGGNTYICYNLGAQESNKNLKKNVKMNLQVQLAGWAVPVNTKVTVKAAPTKPKLTIKPASLTINPGTDDTGVTTWKITPAVFEEDDVVVSRIAEGNRSEQNTAGAADFEAFGLMTGIHDGQFYATTEESFDGSKARTFKVYLSIDGVEYPVTVKTLKQASAMALTLKPAGSINLSIPGSLVKITAATKNFNKDAAAYEVLSITDASRTDVKDHFDIDIEDNVIVLTAGEGLQTGTYTAAVKADGGTVTAEKTVRFTVVDKAAAQSVTLKGKGTIDVLRPDTAVNLTPAFKNCFEYELSNVTITNKAKTDVTEKFNWEENEDGSIAVSIRDGAKVLHTDKYTVTATYKVNGTETTITSKPAKLTVTQGKSSAVIDKKKAEVHKLDSYSLAEVKITLTDDTVAGIDRITYVSPKAGGQEVFTMRELGNDTYAIAFNSNLLPANLKYKGGTVKIQVFMKGNETAKPNTTFNVKVTLK